MPDVDYPQAHVLRSIARERAAVWRAWGRVRPALACLLLLAACDPGPPSGPAPPAGDGGGAPLPDRVVFVDRGLRQAVREAVGKPAGGVTREDADSLRDLDASNRGIASLAGIAQLAGLTSLDLSFNRITDLRPLEGLARLQLLNLEGNEVRDLAPLTGLAELRTVVLNDNGLTDAWALRQLPRLAYVELEDNDIARADLVDLVASLQRAGVRVAGSSGEGGATDMRSRVVRVMDWDEYDLYPGEALAFDGRRWLYVAASKVVDNSEYVRLYVSEDRGGFWQPIETTEVTASERSDLAGRLQRLWFDPDYYSLAFTVRRARWGSSTGLFMRSYDGGRTWDPGQVMAFPDVYIQHPPVTLQLESDAVPLPGRSATYLVNTVGGFMETHSGESWQVSPLAPMVGSLHRLASGGGFVYALAPDGRVRRIHADSTTWETRGLVGSGADHPLALAASAGDGDHLYAAMVTGLYLSVDGGNRWARTLSSGGEPWRAVRLRVSAADPLSAFVIHTVDPSQLWHTVDGGASWRAAGDVFPPESGRHTALRFFYDVAPDPLDPFQAYVSLSSGVYRWYR
ncbi:MAG: leucine-rich repeat domain-containing protein [Gemmatimonadota bacterium]